MHHHMHLIHILSFLPISNSGLNLAAHFKFQIGITVKYASPAFLLSLHISSDSDFPLSAFHIFSLLSLYSDKNFCLRRDWRLSEQQLCDWYQICIASPSLLAHGAKMLCNEKYSPSCCCQMLRLLATRSLACLLVYSPTISPLCTFRTHPLHLVQTCDRDTNS